ncbi:MAG: flagellar biosynthesis protein FlhF [Candidatus Methylomirabilia bacterium]
MLLKRFEAASVAEALAAVRRELGENAVLLHTKTLAPSGVSRLFGRSRVEVLAATDDSLEQAVAAQPKRALREPALRFTKPPARPNGSELRTRRWEPRPMAWQAGRAKAEPQPATGTQGPLTAPAARMSKEDRIRATVRDVAESSAESGLRGNDQTTRPRESDDGARTPGGGRFPIRLQAVYHRLCEQDVPDAMAQALLKGLLGNGHPLKGAEPMTVTARRLLADNLTVVPARWAAERDRARRIAFIGPTGAGKTTTLVKVAARAHLTHHLPVALLTMDTYRIGAIPQLEAYAELLQVPLKVAARPEEMAQALSELDDRDLIFIDTMGRSPLEHSMQELVPFLEAARADEVHLVLSVTTRTVDLLRATDTFARLRPNRLCFTKLDETAHYGGILTVSHQTGLPLTWLGIGQEVPDDLEEAEAERIVACIVSGALL